MEFFKIIKLLIIRKKLLLKLNRRLKEKEKLQTKLSHFLDINLH